MAGRRLTNKQRAAHLARVAELYCSGVRQDEIARRLAVAASQISYDMRILVKRWREAALVDMDTALGETLEKINELERVYWEAWRRSCTPRTRTVRGEIVSPDANGTPRQQTRTVETTEETIGNPAFLQGVQRCIAQRAKLLGLYAADREPPPADENPFMAMSDDELGDHIIHQAQAILARRGETLSLDDEGAGEADD